MKTERKTREEAIEELTETARALAESEERYRTLVENALDIIYSTSSDGMIEDLNPAFEKVMGRSPRDWIGKRLDELIHPDDLSIAAERRSKLFRGEVLPSAEVRLRTIWGDYRVLEFKSVARIKNGKVCGIIGTARDITRRKRMEEALKRTKGLLENHVRERTAELGMANKALKINEMRLEALWELSRLSGAAEREIADFVLDRQVKITGSEFGMFGFINEDETFVTLHTWSEDALGACSLEQSPRPVEESDIWSDLLESRKPMIINEAEEINWNLKGCPHGQAHLHRVMTVPVFAGDRIAAVAMVANKATPYDESDARQVSLLLEGMLNFMERERADKALRNSERLAAMGMALAGLAHDIKTPLVSIGGFAQLVQRHLKPGSRDHTALEVVLKETRRLQAMIKDMLDFSRPLELETAPENLCKVVEETIELVSDEARKKNVELSAYLSQCENPVPMDGMRMRQALVNLVMNAVQATPEGLHVSVKLARTNRQIVLDVVDKGGGIPQRQRSEVFSPFFTTKKDGTGLGLPIAKKIVEAHKGRIEILDNPDAGVTFRMMLPT